MKTTKFNFYEGQFIPFVLLAVLLPQQILAQEYTSVGMFDQIADWGVLPNTQIGVHKIPGRIEIGVEDGVAYQIFGNGNDLWGDINEGFMAYTEREGSWRISGKVHWIDSGGGSINAKLGLMIRDNPTSPDSNYVFSMLFSPERVESRDDLLITNYKQSKNGPLKEHNFVDEDGKEQKIVDPGDGLFVRLTRFAPLQAIYSEWSFDGEEWFPGSWVEVDMGNSVGYGLAITNKMDNDLLAHGQAKELQLEPVPLFAQRTISEEMVMPDEIINVTVEIYHEEIGEQSFPFTELIPEGWTASEITHNGVFENGRIVWGGLTLSERKTNLHYKLSPPQNVKGTYHGYITTGSNIFLRDSKIFFNAGLPDDMGILDDTSNLGHDPEYPPSYSSGKTEKYPGGFAISEDENGLVYDVYGNGFEIMYETDEGFYAYTMRSGAWQFSAKVNLIDMNSDHFSCRAGLLVSNNPNSTWSRRIFMPLVGHKKPQNEGTISRTVSFAPRIQEKTFQSSGGGYTLRIGEKTTDGVYLRFTRLPDSDQAYGEWSADGKDWNYLGYTDIEFQDEIAYGFALCNLQSGPKLGHARYSDVKLDSFQGVAANRSFRSNLYTVDEEIDVKLTVHNYNDTPAAIQITENVPDGINIVEAGKEGTIQDGNIVWNTTIEPGMNMFRYTLTVPHVIQTDLTIQGTINDLPVFGDEDLEREIVVSDAPPPGIWRTLTKEDGFSGNPVVGMYPTNDGSIVLNERNTDYDSVIEVYDGFTFSQLPPLPPSEHFIGPPKRIIQNEKGEYWTFVTRTRPNHYHTGISGFARLNGQEWERFLIDELKSEFAIANFFDHQAMLPVPGGIVFEFKQQLMYWPYESRSVVSVFPQSILKQFNFGNKAAGTLVKGPNGSIIRGHNKGFIRFNEQLLTERRALEPSELEIVQYDEGIHAQILENITETKNGDVYGLALGGEYPRWGSGEKKYLYLHYDGNAWSVLYQGAYTWNSLIAFPGWGGGVWLNERDTALQYVNNNMVQLFDDDTVFTHYMDVVISSDGSFMVSGGEDEVALWSPSLWQELDYFAPHQIDQDTLYQSPDDVLWALSADHQTILSLDGNELTEWDVPTQISAGEFQETTDGDLWFYDSDHLLFFDGSEWEYMPYPFDNLEFYGMKAISDRSLIFYSGWKGFIVPFSPFSPNHEFAIHYAPFNQVIPNQVWVANDHVYLSQRDGFHQYRDGNYITLIPDEIFSDELQGNSANLIFASDGMVWFYGSNGVMRWDGSETKLFDDDSFADGVYSIAERQNGNIFAGGQGTLFEYDGNEWSAFQIPVLADSNITLLHESHDGILWMETDTGFMARKDGNWIEFGKEESFPTEDVVSISSDKLGRVWLTLNNGKLIAYQSSADTDPPRTEMHEEFSRRESNSLGEITHTFTAIDRWKYTLPERLYFSHRTNEDEWSPFSSNNTATLMGLEPGDHRFEVRSMDRNWNIDPNPVQWEFLVPYPWYQQPQFIVTSIIGSLLTLIALLYALNRHMKLRESFVALQTAQDQLVQSEKMASLGQLVAGVAHEINNPVNYIKGNITPLRDYFFGYKEITEHIQENKERLPKDIQDSFQQLSEQHDLDYIIKDSAKLIESFEDGSDRIATIVDDLRQYSRVDKNYFSLMDLHESIDSTLNLLHSKMEDGITVHKKYGSIPQTKCSPGQIGQVFMNILNNAIDAVGEEGNIWIATYLQSNQIIISIKDDGAGIPTDIQSKIFDPFFTTKSVGSGTGLGLSISHTIIEQHEGMIKISSEEGNGAEFLISIPVA